MCTCTHTHAHTHTHPFTYTHTCIHTYRQEIAYQARCRESLLQGRWPPSVRQTRTCIHRAIYVYVLCMQTMFEYVWCLLHRNVCVCVCIKTLYEYVLCIYAFCGCVQGWGRQLHRNVCVCTERHMCVCTMYNVRTYVCKVCVCIMYSVSMYASTLTSILHRCVRVYV
jgi:hypothetical protein